MGALLGVVLAGIAILLVNYGRAVWWRFTPGVLARAKHGRRPNTCTDSSTIY
jgi:hypothetical protein